MLALGWRRRIGSMCRRGVKDLVLAPGSNAHGAVSMANDTVFYE